MRFPRRPAHATDGFVLGPLVPARSAGTPAMRALSGGWLRAAQAHWLHLRLAPTEAACEVRVVLNSASLHWPGLSQTLLACDGEAQAWVFVTPGTRAVWFQGDAAVLSELCWLGATVHTALPAQAPAILPMRSAAHLHGLGVRSLHGVTFTDDADWPLQATAPDAQLHFKGLAHAGMLRVHAQLRRQADAAVVEGPPLLCWGEDRHTRNRAMDGGPLRWQSELPLLRDGTCWHLQPMARSGLFALDTLDTELIQPVLHPVRRVLNQGKQWLQDLRLRHTESALRPVHELQPLAHSAHHTPAFHASGHDPYFRLSKPVAAGWYMLELGLELPCARHRARVYLNDGSGERETAAWSLPVRTGRVSKRLLWAPKRSTLRLDPMSMPGDFKLLHFRLQRVSSGFARSRMLRRLKSGTPQQGLEFETADLDALWYSYCQGFEPHHQGSISYDEWIRQIEAPSLPCAQQQQQQLQNWAWQPLFSIITVSYNTPVQRLRECLDSVLAQGYPHWQLCLVDDASTDPAVTALLQEYAARDARIELRLRPRHAQAAAAGNTALDAARGELVALLAPEDRLAPHALFAVAQALQQRPQAQIVYSDEDQLDAQDRRCAPYFKPDWSPDLLRSQHYVSHLAVYRTALVREVGGLRSDFEGGQDYDLLLRCTERLQDPRNVLHVPQVLYHARQAQPHAVVLQGDPPGAAQAAYRALQAHAERQGRGVRVSELAPGLFRALWPVPEPAPLVSLIIPTRDALDVLRVCVESIVHATLYSNYELLIVDNQSRDPETLAWLEALPQCLGPQRVRVLRWDAPFNYSAINNFAATQARGSVLGLINNDVEVISPDWLGEMVSHAVRPEVGCVGAKLYYPDDTIQHAGVVVGLSGVAGHAHVHFPRDADGYFKRLHAIHNVSAVTGAVLLLRKTVFDEVGGLDAEHLHVDYNDVDLCLKARAAGYLNVWTPFAELYHHESKTRGRSSSSPEKQQRFQHECNVMLQRWRIGAVRDPFYNPNLSLMRPDYSLALLRGDSHGAASATVQAGQAATESSQ